MHQDARYNCGNFKVYFDSLRSVQLVARIDALNLVIHLKSAVTLRPVLSVIGFKTIRILCIKMHATTAMVLRRVLLRSVQLVARIIGIN